MSWTSIIDSLTYGKAQGARSVWNWQRFSMDFQHHIESNASADTSSLHILTVAPNSVKMKKSRKKRVNSFHILHIACNILMSSGEERVTIRSPAGVTRNCTLANLMFPAAKYRIDDFSFGAQRNSYNSLLRKVVCQSGMLSSTKLYRRKQALFVLTWRFSIPLAS